MGAIMNIIFEILSIKIFLDVVYDKDDDKNEDYDNDNDDEDRCILINKED